MDDPPFAGITAGTQPKCGNGGVSDAVTSELGDRQSSHPVKNPASVLWQVFLPGVAYPGVRDNRSTLNTKTGYKKNVIDAEKGQGYYHPSTHAAMA